MINKKKNKDQPDWANIQIAVIVANWNSFVTDTMLQGAVDALKARGIPEPQIHVRRCPGSFELPLACKLSLEELPVDGVVALGAVIRGDTPHFDYVCRAVTDGIAQLNLEYSKPVAFGVLTTDTVQQARERAGIDQGNKGAEAAVALCDMLVLHLSLRNNLVK